MSLDSLFRNEILEDLEEETFFDDDDCLVEASMSSDELDLLDEAENMIFESDKDLDDFLDDNNDDDINIDDLIDMEDISYE